MDNQEEVKDTEIVNEDNKTSESESDNGEIKEIKTNNEEEVGENCPIQEC